MDFFEFMQADALVLASDAISTATTKLAIKTIMPVTLSIALIIGVYQYLIENGTLGIELKEIFRLILLSFMIFAFTDLINIVDRVAMGAMSYYHDEGGDDANKEVVKLYIMNSAKRNFPGRPASEYLELKNSLKGDVKADKKAYTEFVETQNKKKEAQNKNAFIPNLIMGFISELSAIYNDFSGWMRIGLNESIMFILQVVIWFVILAFTIILKAVGPLALAVTSAQQNRNKYSLGYSKACGYITKLRLSNALKGFF